MVSTKITSVLVLIVCVMVLVTEGHFRYGKRGEPHRHMFKSMKARLLKLAQREATDELQMAEELEAGEAKEENTSKLKSNEEGCLDEDSMPTEGEVLKRCARKEEIENYDNNNNKGNAKKSGTNMKNGSQRESMNKRLDAILKKLKTLHKANEMQASFNKQWLPQEKDNLQQDTQHNGLVLDIEEKQNGLASDNRPSDASTVASLASEKQHHRVWHDIQECNKLCFRMKNKARQTDKQKNLHKR